MYQTYRKISNTKIRKYSKSEKIKLRRKLSKYYLNTQIYRAYEEFLQCKCVLSSSSVLKITLNLYTYK